MNQQQSFDLRQYYDKLVESGAARNIEALVHCPLGMGYFFKFCKSQYCSETIHFLIEVDKYIEIFNTDDGGWDPQRTWKDIDAQIQAAAAAAAGELQATTESAPAEAAVPLTHKDITEWLQSENFIPAATWPSGKVDRLAVIEAVRSIWSRFIADTAPEQVCLPASVVKNTCKRLMHVELYGRELFQEACRDRDILTTQRDIAARFEKTEDYQVYLKRLEDLLKPSCMVTIHIPAPRCVITISHTKNQLLESQNEVLFSLEDTLKDGFLYAEFMKYLNLCMASEHLRLVRAVYIFRKMLSSPDPAVQKKASDWAFKVYQNFLCPGASYEVCCPVGLRREIARNIATPHCAMFKVPEREALGTLHGLYEAYQKTPEYSTLRVRIADNFDALHAVAPSANSISSHTMNSKLSAAGRVLQHSHHSHSQSRHPPGSQSNSHHSTGSSKNLLAGPLSPGLTRSGSNQGMPKPSALLSIAPVSSTSTHYSHTPTSSGTIGTAASRLAHLQAQQQAQQLLQAQQGQQGQGEGSGSSGRIANTAAGAGAGGEGIAGGAAVRSSSGGSGSGSGGLLGANANAASTGAVPSSPASRLLPLIAPNSIAEDTSAGDRELSERSSSKRSAGALGFLHLPAIQWFSRAPR